MTQKVDFITIIVCTYNRADILRDCLTALFEQTAPKNLYEVLVVDNNSADHTKQVVETYQKKHTNLRYILEKKQGLSQARNTGFKNTSAKWVGYMDDDGKPHTNYIDKTLEIINIYNFDCFGGRYLPWYRTPKPRWLDPNFGQSEVLRDTIGVLEESHNSGGIIFFKTTALKEANGFSPKIGMSGNKIAYGEETLVQNEMRQLGKIIGYSPFIMMDHLVAEYKFKVLWHIKSYYAHGRDNTNIWKVKQKTSTFSFIKLVLLKFKKAMKINFPKLITKKDYYIQNLLIDVCQPIAYLYGTYKAQKKNNE